MDVEKNILIGDMEMRADGEQKLLEMTSEQSDLWGINLYPSRFGGDAFVEFDSMINIPPRQGNMSRNIEDPKIIEKIIDIIAQKVKP